MSIWNKILLSLIFVTGAVFAVLVANLYRLAKQCEDKLATQAKTIEDLTSAVAKLHGEIFSDSTSAVLEWSKMSLNPKMKQLAALRNGELWIHCQRPSVPQADGELLRTSFCLEPSVKPRQHDNLLFKNHAPVFIFDSGIQASAAGTADNAAADNTADSKTADASAGKTSGTAATFLGAFLIDGFNEQANEVLVKSVGVMTEEEKDLLFQSAQSGNEWFVYVNQLPSDSPVLLAEWLSDPNDTIAPLLTDEMRAYLCQTGQTAEQAAPADDLSVDEMTLEPADAGSAADEAVAGNADAINENDPFSVQADENAAVLGSLFNGKRHPVDYTEQLYRRFNARIMNYLAIDYVQHMIDDWRNVIADQLAAIGYDEVPEEILKQIGPVPEESAKLVQTFAEAKTALIGTTKMAKKEELTALLDAAKKEVDVVKKQLDKTAAAVSGLKERIDSLLSENNELAVKIATAQFEAADKIIQESEDKTADSSLGLMLTAPQSDI